LAGNKHKIVKKSRREVKRMIIFAKAFPELDIATGPIVLQYVMLF